MQGSYFMGAVLSCSFSNKPIQKLMDRKKAADRAALKQVNHLLFDIAGLFPPIFLLLTVPAKMPLT